MSDLAATSIVSPNIRVRYPDHLIVGEHSVIDDYCYLATRITIGDHCHVANNCSIAGGPRHHFVLGSYSSLSAGVRVWCASNDFRRGLVALLHDSVDESAITGDVIFDRLTGVGANTVVMPANHIPEGVTIGALSFVPPRYAFEPWTVYAGIPIRPIGQRDREQVFRQLASLR